MFGRILGERHKKTNTQSQIFASPTKKTCFMLISAGLCGLPRESCWLRGLSKNSVIISLMRVSSTLMSFQTHEQSTKLFYFKTCSAVFVHSMEGKTEL